MPPDRNTIISCQDLVDSLPNLLIAQAAWLVLVGGLSFGAWRPWFAVPRSTGIPGAFVISGR